MKYFIVTGASKGLGKAIVNRLLETNNKVFGISRTSNQEHLNNGVVYVNVDLSNTESIVGTIKSIISDIKINSNDEFYLINNAGTINPIKTIENTDVKSLIKNINVNLTSLMVLSSEFISSLENFDGKKRILNISSGAAKRPVAGWNIYCSAKAGVDMFTQTVALEQNSKNFPTHLMAIAPGIMDTNMQEEIRSSDIKNFRDLEQFKNFKEKGALLSPDIVAKGILKLLLGADFINGDITRIENYL